MSDIFKEVEEEVRRDQLLALWKKYRVLIIVVVLAVVLGVAGFQGWTAYVQHQRTQAAEAYGAAEAHVAAGEQQEAAEAFAELADPDAGGYALLASFEVARLAAETGNGDLALEYWGRIAESSAAQTFRDAAVLAAARYRLDAGEASEAEMMLEPLGEPGRPYRSLAVELSAAAALAQGERETARERLEVLLADVETPPGVRERAGELAATLAE